MTQYPIQTLIDDLKTERKSIVEAMKKSGFDMEKAKALAVVQAAIVAVEAQRDDDSDWPAGGGVEPKSYPDD
jgi:hypothetical protein